MICITGDTHLPIDICKLYTKRFPEQRKMTKNDYVLIGGDFGGIWDNSSQEKKWLKWLSNKKFTTLFIDGNHENFDKLNKYEVSEWNGGKVHIINESIIHLMRGQVYTIEGLNIFTMGGAESTDIIKRKEGKTWWKEEVPSNKEFDEALDNLDKVNWEVDIIVTHTASLNNIISIGKQPKNYPLTSFFNILEKDLKYRKWFFGHFHEDIIIDEKHIAIFNKIIRIK